jgi:hypothetical protein
MMKGIAGMVPAITKIDRKTGLPKKTFFILVYQTSMPSTRNLVFFLTFYKKGKNIQWIQLERTTV